MKWQPIETAPKDGSKVLVGRFDPTGETHWPNNVVHVDYWHTYEHHTFEGFGKFNAKFWPATHWMPLPPPPENK